MIGPLRLGCWTLALSVGLFRLKKNYDVDLVLGLLTQPPAMVIAFGFADEPSSFLFNIEDSIVHDLRDFKDPRGSAVTHPVLSVRIGTGVATMEWVLLWLKRHEADIVLKIQTCARFRVLFVEHSQFGASLGANNSGRASQAGVQSG